MSAPLTPEFWANVSESRRRRIRRRTRRRAAVAGFFGGVAGSLVTIGILHDNVQALFWGVVLVLCTLARLMYVTSPRRSA